MQPSASPNQLALLLWDLRSLINLGMLLRVAETYRVDVAVLGSRAVLDDHEKMRTVSDFACGALERAGFAELTDETAVKRFAEGRRLIATSVEPSSVGLHAFAFHTGDIVMIGNEYDGLAASALAAASATIRIPMADVWTPKPPSSRPIDAERAAPVARDGMPSLNAAIAGGILCYQWHIDRMRANAGPL